MRFVAVPPCQCFTFGGIEMTSPGWISRRSRPHSWTHPVPDVTISVWPAGWICHAVRAPGSKLTSAPPQWVCPEASKSGSMTTDPVKLCAGPFAEGRDPFGLIWTCCSSFIDTSDRQKGLDRAPLVHRTVRLSYLLEWQREIEDSAGIDLLLADQFDQLGQETAYWGGPAVQSDVRVEQRRTVKLHAVRHAH